MNIEESIKYIKNDIEVDKDTASWFDDINNPTRKQIEESIDAYETLLTAYEKEREKNSNAKWYIHQEIVRIEEDIEDYIDDDKEGNKDIIGEFKENLKQWQDVEKLLDGKSKDELYIDWRKYGKQSNS